MRLTNMCAAQGQLKAMTAKLSSSDNSEVVVEVSCYQKEKRDGRVVCVQHPDDELDLVIFVPLLPTRLGTGPADELLGSEVTLHGPGLHDDPGADSCRDACPPLRPHRA